MGAIEEDCCTNVTRMSHDTHECHTICTRFLQQWQRIYTTVVLLETYCSRMHKTHTNGYKWTRMSHDTHECHTNVTHVTHMLYDSSTYVDERGGHRRMPTKVLNSLKHSRAFTDCWRMLTTKCVPTRSSRDRSTSFE